MKTLLSLSILALMAAATSSCRTAVPMDPNTMELSCRCMPDRFQAPPPADCGPRVQVRTYSK